MGLGQGSESAVAEGGERADVGWRVGREEVQAAVVRGSRVAASLQMTSMVSVCLYGFR